MVKRRRTDGELMGMNIMDSRAFTFREDSNEMKKWRIQFNERRKL
jgi:hypothetical protein